MASILLDTNIIVYWAHESSPMHENVSQLIRKAAACDYDMYVLASSLSDAYYVLRSHYMSEPAARRSIENVADSFILIDLTTDMVHEALHSDEPDYEDGLIRAAAETLQVDAIISYDAKAFHNSFVPKYTAVEAATTLFAAAD